MKTKVDKYIYDELKHMAGLKPDNALKKLQEFLTELEPLSKRTTQQNRALHKFFALLAESLNMAGLEMRVVLKEDTNIWWTVEGVKEYLWKPVQIAMYQKASTTELEKGVEIDKIHEQLMHLLAEKHEVEWIEFPNDPSKYQL